VTEGAASVQALDARIEAFLKEKTDVEINFEVSDALCKLFRLGLVRRDPQGGLHALPIDEALRAKGEGRERVVLFNLSGHGHVDMAAYDEYFAGKLEDFEYPSEKVRESLQNLPQVAL